MSAVSRFQREGRWAQALRFADRAWRTQAGGPTHWAPILGRLLVRDGAHPDAGLMMLSRAADLIATPTAEAELIDALRLHGRFDIAKARLHSALKRFACVPSAPLAIAARRLMAEPGARLDCWAGITPALEFHFEHRASDQPIHLEMWSADRSLLNHKQLRVGQKIVSARLPINDPGRNQYVTITANGASVLGGECILPLDFRLEASVAAQDDRVVGKLRLGWHPDATTAVRLTDDQQWQRQLQAKNGKFAIRLDRARWRHPVRVQAVMPDGSLEDFPDSPLVFKAALKRNLRQLEAQRSRQARPLNGRRPVDVIVPVYQGHDETLACIASILSTIGDLAAQVIVINDHSPDMALESDLEGLHASGTITLLKNSANLGFAATINRAMMINPGHDAVIVNADVLVFGDWLRRLRRAAYQADNIASVTPFADDDSIVQYADSGTKAGNPHLAEQLNQYAASLHNGVTVELPVGVGFCMYIRRKAWRETGEFDAATFTRGYGEESDWCMRASLKGWRHRLAADVFVHHAGGRSFGPRRGALLNRAQRIMNLRYPGYDQKIRDFFKKDDLLPLRRNFDAKRLSSQPRPIVLVIMLALSGGVDRHVGDRCKELQEQGKLPVLLRPYEEGPDTCWLWNFDPKLAYLRYRIPEELKEIRLLLGKLPLESIEFHHFLGLDAKLIRTVLGLGVPYDIFLHDYSWICPRITLMDESGRYCGEPALAACERCVQRNGSDLMEDIRVGTLRQRSGKWIRGARRVAAPSFDVVKRYTRYFPDQHIDVVPLEKLKLKAALPSRISKGVIRVALLGAIGEHKGYKVLLECARYVRARKLGLEFVVIGYTEDDVPLLRTGKVFVTGQYSESEIPALLQREDPDLIWLPSVWPETWCYTLTHALSSGLPVVAFDIGAIAERLRNLDTGHLMPMGLRPAQIIQQLSAIARGEADAMPARGAQMQGALP